MGIFLIGESLMLLLAALFHSDGAPDREQIKRILYHPTETGRTRVRPFIEREPLLKAIVFEKGTSATESLFYKNFEFFKGAIAGNLSVIWSGLKNLECVDIKITAGETAQQVFESMNSTGKPLTDAELINNYILIGYKREIQDDIEKNYWIDQFEKNTMKNGESQLNDFFRHYLSLETGTRVEVKQNSSDRIIFVTFKEFFKASNVNLKDEATLRQWCEKWKALSACYNLLLNPSEEADAEIQEYLFTLNKFGESAYPFLMAVLNDYKQGTLDRSTLLQVLHLLETFYFRRAVCVRTEIDRNMLPGLYGKLKGAEKGHFFRNFELKLFLSIPSDESVEQSLREGCKNHGTDVLLKLDGKTNKDVKQIGAQIDIEHIFPQNPDHQWSNGDHVCNEDETQQMSVWLNSIGNWAPLESSLNIGASNNSFADKKEYYKQSQFGLIKELLDVKVWDIKAIEDRTKRLTEAFLNKWTSPKLAQSEDAVNILAVTEAPGNAIVNRNKYEAAWFRGKPLQARNTIELTIEVCKIFIENNDTDVLLQHGLVKKKGSGQDIRINNDFCLPGWFPQYILKGLKEVLTEKDLADELFVKFAEAE